MATAVQEQSRLRAIIAAEDRALERTLQQATARTLSAVRRLVAGQRNAGARIRRAWRRPPPKHFQRQMTARKGRALPGSGARGVTFHFALNRTHSGKNAAAHQHYIEREEACVASFGNIADEFSERCRVWEAIDERGGQRKGSIHIGANAPGPLRAMAIESMERWRDEGRVPGGTDGEDHTAGQDTLAERRRQDLDTRRGRSRNDGGLVAGLGGRERIAEDEPRRTEGRRTDRRNTSRTAGIRDQRGRRCGGRTGTRKETQGAQTQGSSETRATARLRRVRTTQNNHPTADRP